MNLKKLFFASALLFAACGTIQAQEVIAHRGFWTTDGSAQNSLAALCKRADFYPLLRLRVRRLAHHRQSAGCQS